MELFTKTIDSLWQVVVIGLVLGAGLPIVFACGVRLLATDSESQVGDTSRRRPLNIAAAIVCFALIVAAVITGILLIARDFIHHTFGLHLF
ncbi:hypothetical protein FOS14_19240 [Skermania sp. ID1734]|uniref:hypothetical protein n=1 Tax=Skermania sp. ID1734 TaxID=2597516 RepID=UPI00117D96AC|nr:hypothetical protein [Skermania sp. ID1734]TSD95119.1 hypothetical protein FOS14_19240 [Skermania sp. ID1734]